MVISWMAIVNREVVQLHNLDFCYATLMLFWARLRKAYGSSTRSLTPHEVQITEPFSVPSLPLHTGQNVPYPSTSNTAITTPIPNPPTSAAANFNDLHMIS
jgi:hypothetical protein